jgi:chromosomal replication initiator protein
MLLASRIRTNIRLMEGTLNRIAAYASLTGGLPDAPALEELLRDTMVDGEGANITIRRIQKKVAEHFRITIATLLGKERSSRIAFPRQIAMYLCRAIVQSPYADIGAAFAGRDHTTAIHACRTMGDLLRGSSEAREIVDELTTAIRS